MINFEQRIRTLILKKREEVKKRNNLIKRSLGTCEDKIFAWDKKDILSNHSDWRRFRVDVSYCRSAMLRIGRPLVKYLPNNPSLKKMRECIELLEQAIKLMSKKRDRSGQKVDLEKVRELILKANNMYVENVFLHVNELVRESLKRSLKKVNKIIL
jgi:hypothetical protein